MLKYFLLTRLCGSVCIYDSVARILMDSVQHRLQLDKAYSPGKAQIVYFPIAQASIPADLVLSVLYLGYVGI